MHVARSLLFTGVSVALALGIGSTRDAAACGGFFQPPAENTTVGSVTLGECLTCGGVWADASSFERICSEREEQSIVLGTAFPTPASGEAPPKAHLLERYWPCPQCGRLMNRVNFAHCSGVVVDVCKPHGVWFDHDELHEIVLFIRGGGLDHARQQEKEDLEHQRQLLKADAQGQALREMRRGDSSPWAGAPVSASGAELEVILSAVREVIGWLR